jgi:hypothetical protein
MCTRRTLLSRSKLGLTEAASLHAIIEQAQKEALKHKDVGRIHPSQEGYQGLIANLGKYATDCQDP